MQQRNFGGYSNGVNPNIYKVLSVGLTLGNVTYEQIINQHIENSLEIQKKCLAKRIKQYMR